MDTESGKTGFGIFYKILVAMLVVSLVPLGAYWYIARVKSIQDWTVNGERSLRLASDAVASRVDAWIDTNLLALRYAASLADIESMDPARQDPILERLSAGYPWSYLSFTTDAGGKNIGRSDGQERTDYSDRVYYRQVIQEGRDLGHQTLIGRTSGKPALVLAVPIDDGGKRIGLVAAASKLTEITEAVVGSSVGESGFAFLLDADGKAVAHPQEELSNTLRDMSDHPAHQAVKLAGDDRVVLRYRDDGRDVIAVATKIGLGWVLVVQQDAAEVFRAVREADRNALYLFSAAFVIVVILSLLLAGRLTRPILQLAKVADEMSRGNFDGGIVATARHDEIGELARAIERMGMSIRVATHRLRSKQTV